MQTFFVLQHLCQHLCQHLRASLNINYPFLSCLVLDDGVSIPCSYTSFLAPLSSSKLYNEVRGCRERDKHPECHFETPYVVRLHNFHELADRSQTLLHFLSPHNKWISKHFIEESPLYTFFLLVFWHNYFLFLLDMNNNRYQCLRFTVDCNSVLHGFAGYFETTLYSDVTLSK